MYIKQIEVGFDSSSKALPIENITVTFQDETDEHCASIILTQNEQTIEIPFDETENLTEIMKEVRDR